MSGKPEVLARRLAVGVIVASLAACAGGPPRQTNANSSLEPSYGAQASMIPPIQTNVTSSLEPSNGVPASMMRSDGTMINGLLPASPYY
jgi:hypothetical protein